MITQTPYSNSVLLPRVEEIAREMTSGTQIQMILRRVKKLSPLAFVRLGMNNVRFLPLLAKKDFATGIKLLCELEILASKPKSVWIFHYQMTDMSIALHNARLIQNFLGLAKMYNFTPAIATANPERFVQFLSTVRNLPKNLVVFCPRSSSAFERFAKESPIYFRFTEV